MITAGKENGKDKADNLSGIAIRYSLLRISGARRGIELTSHRVPRDFIVVYFTVT
jgi:hypothetical protein